MLEFFLFKYWTDKSVLLTAEIIKAPKSHLLVSKAINGVMQSQQLRLYCEKKKSAKIVENSNLTFYMETYK